MTVSYATVSSAGSGPGPRFDYEFEPQTDGTIVTKTADSYTHTGAFEATTNAAGAFTVDIPLGLDQGTVVWKITQRPVTRVPGARALKAQIVGYVNITATTTYEALTASLIEQVVTAPDVTSGDLADEALATGVNNPASAVRDALDARYVTATITGDPSDPDVTLYLNGVEL